MPPVSIADLPTKRIKNLAAKALAVSVDALVLYDQSTDLDKQITLANFRLSLGIDTAVAVTGWDIIIDSNTKLDTWLSDTTGAYVNVYIKTGTWTSAITAPTGGIFINLDSGGPGTRRVYGEPGAKIVLSASLNGTLYGFRHATLPTSFMTERFEGFELQITNTLNTGGGSVTGFYRCKNLKFVKSNAVATNTSAAGRAYESCSSILYCEGVCNATAGVSSAFASCTHLTGCVGTGATLAFYSGSDYTGCIATANGIAGAVDAIGFSSCDQLVNCVSTATGASTGYGKGFVSCNNLSSCIGTGSGNGSGTGAGFDTCNNLSSCIGTGNGGATGPGYGFNTCTMVVASSGTGNGGASSGNGAGFNSCTQLSACKGVGLAAGSGTGYGFVSCSGFNQLLPLSASKTGTFSSTTLSTISTNDAALSGSSGADLVNTNFGLTIPNTGFYLLIGKASTTSTGNADAQQLSMYDATNSADIGNPGPEIPHLSTSDVLSGTVSTYAYLVSGTVIRLKLRRNGASTPNFVQGGASLVSHSVEAIQIG